MQRFQLVRAPTTSGRFSYQHTFDIGRSRLLFNVQTRISASYWRANDFLPAERANAYHVSDMTLTFVEEGGRYEVAGFVRNLEDHAIYTQASESSGVNGLILATVNAPHLWRAT